MHQQEGPNDFTKAQDWYNRLIWAPRATVSIVSSDDKLYMGVSLNGGTPKHPKMIIFSRKTHGCWVPAF